MFMHEDWRNLYTGHSGTEPIVTEENFLLIDRDTRPYAVIQTFKRKAAQNQRRYEERNAIHIRLELWIVCAELIGNLRKVCWRKLIGRDKYQ